MKEHKPYNISVYLWMFAFLSPILTIILSFILQKWGWGLMDDWAVLNYGPGVSGRFWSLFIDMLKFGEFRPTFALHSAVFYTIFENHPQWFYPKAPHGAMTKNFPIGVITTTRGCPYRCIFCASPKLYNGKIRYRSPENVIKEIIYLVDNYGVKEIHFEDDNLTFNKEHIEKICNLIIQGNLRISWACPNGIRADKVDVNLIKLMVKSGCYYFAYGIESSDPVILKNIKKDICIETIEGSIKIAEKEGVSCQGFFIFGLPGETVETIKKTINFAKKTKLSRAQFLILDIVPGSELWYTLKGKFNPNWNKDSFREPEWIPEGLTEEQLMKAQVRAFRSFYLRLPVVFKLLKLIRLSQVRFLLQRLKEYRILN